MTAPVLLVIEAPGHGGTEVYVDGLARHLIAKRAVTIVTLSGAQTEAEARFPDIPVTAVAGPSGLGGLLKRAAPGTIAHLHLYSRLLWAALRAKRARARVVTTFHMPLDPWNTRHRLQWRAAAALSDVCVGVSQACLDSFGWQMRLKTTAVIPVSIDFAALPVRSPPRRERPFTIAGAGRLSVEKDWPTLIRAAAQIPNARLVLIGDGPLEAELKALASGLGVDAEFTGRLLRADLLERVAGADMFVLPSRFEGLGIAAIEAMALGDPTITADFPASGEYIREGETGFRFPHGDVAALAALIAKLQQDPERAAKIGAAGAADIRARYASDALYPQYARLYDSKPQQIEAPN